MTRNGKTTAFGFCSVALLLIIAATLAATSDTEPAVTVRLLQQSCEASSGVLYTAKGFPDAPAICHKKGPALSTDEPLWGWETVYFVEGQR